MVVRDRSTILAVDMGRDYTAGSAAYMHARYHSIGRLSPVVWSNVPPFAPTTMESTMDILFWLYDLFNGGPLTPFSGSVSGSMQWTIGSLEGLVGSLEGLGS